MKKKYIPKKKSKYNSGVNYIEPNYEAATNQAQRNTAVDSALTGVVSSIPGAGRYAGIGSALGTAAQGMIGTNANGAPKIGGSAVGSGLKYAGMGASLGSSFGPLGTAIGAGVGAIGGAAFGAIQAKDIQASMKDAEYRANFTNFQNENYSAKDTEQVGYAKNGLEITKKGKKDCGCNECSNKYPDGTKEVKTVDPPTGKDKSNMRREPSKLSQTEDAKTYYKNIRDVAYKTVKGEGYKFDGKGEGAYDQVRTEKNPNSPNYGKQVLNNTCVGYACHIAKEAGAKEKKVEYNPFFTRDHQSLGWERIPVDSAQTGDRVQFWEEDNTGGRKVKDLGDNKYIHNKYPKHMGVYMSKSKDGGTYTYEDGDSQRAAKVAKRSINDSTATVFRYVGVNKQYNNGTQEIMGKVKYKPKYPNGTGNVSAGKPKYNVDFDRNTQDLPTAQLNRTEIDQLNALKHDPQAYKTQLHKTIGYVPKYVNPKQGTAGWDYENEQYNMAVKTVNRGFRPIYKNDKVVGMQRADQNNDSYNKGVKQIEVEGDELHFSKTSKGYKLKADYEGGPSHEAGGIPTVGVEGDVIVPANQRAKVEKMMDGNGNIVAKKKFEKYRRTLPKDKPVAADGDLITPRGLRSPSSGLMDTSVVNPLTSRGFNSTGLINTTANLGRMQLPQSPAALPPSPMNFNPTNTIGTMAEVAPIAYNLGRGLFGKAEKTNRRLYNPQNYTYQDQSQGLRNDVNTAYNQDKQAIRNASGGNAGTYLANVGMASANRFKRNSAINNQEMSRRNDITNANTDINNQAQLTNLNLNNQYDQMDQVNRATKDNLTATGLSQLSQFSQQRTKDAGMRDVQNVILNNLSTNNYRVNPKTMEIEKNGKGNSGVKVGKKYKYKRK